MDEGELSFTNASPGRGRKAICLILSPDARPKDAGDHDLADPAIHMLPGHSYDVGARERVRFPGSDLNEELDFIQPRLRSDLGDEVPVLRLARMLWLSPTELIPGTHDDLHDARPRAFSLAARRSHDVCSRGRRVWCAQLPSIRPCSHRMPLRSWY